jgi:hypothetical protein
MMKRIKRFRAIALSLFAITAPFSIHAADTGIEEALQGFDEPEAERIDDALQGFDATTTPTDLDAALGGFDEAAETDSSFDAPRDEKAWQLGGALTLGAAYNYAHPAPAAGDTDFRGLSRLRAKLNLEHNYDFNDNWRSHVAGYGYYDLAYQLKGRGNYSNEVLEEYESELELGEVWLQGRLNTQTDLKLGRQIVVWGKSDNIRITDLINPLDNREPGMVDIEDLRLPLAMARLDYYVGDWGFTALAIPEIRFNKMPPFGSDFYPQSTPVPAEEVPTTTEFGLAANGIFSGWDLSLYWASLYDDSPHTVTTTSGAELQHARLNMAGLAANVAINNWLLKGEAAHFSGIEYSSQPGESFDRTDALIGIEYSGLRDTTLSLEIANRHLHDYHKALINEGVKEDEWQTALRYQGDFLHARLHLLALISRFGEQFDEGGFGRYSAAYDLADGLTLTGGIVNFESGEKFPFTSYGDNDRLFVDLKYSF